jgi:hypothetical protein
MAWQHLGGLVDVQKIVNDQMLARKGMERALRWVNNRKPTIGRLGQRSKAETAPFVSSVHLSGSSRLADDLIRLSPVLRDALAERSAIGPQQHFPTIYARQARACASLNF